MNYNILINLWLFILISILFISCNRTFDNSLLNNELSDKIIFSRCSVEGIEEIEIWITDPDGNNQSMVIKKEGDSLTVPVWSPDGKKIVFTQHKNPLMKALYKDKSFRRICLIDYHRGKEMILTDDSWKSSEPCWSPDGKQVVFVAGKNNSDMDIYVMEIDSKKIEKMASTLNMDTEPIWAPDGKYIAFISDIDYESKLVDLEYNLDKLLEYIKTKGNSDIYILNVNSKNLIKLTDNPTNDSNISWSPDGRKIVYTSWRGNDEIFVIDIDTKSEIRLTNNSEEDCRPEWSPDGKKIAFISEHMLYLMDPDGKNKEKLTDKTQCYISYGWRLNWSPDSKKIVFVAQPPHSSQEKNFPDDIYIIDIDTKNLKNLTNTPNYREACPSWRPIPKD